MLTPCLGPLLAAPLEVVPPAVQPGPAVAEAGVPRAMAGDGAGAGVADTPPAAAAKAAAVPAARPPPRWLLPESAATWPQREASGSS